MSKPRLGQHFLIDRAYLPMILKAAELSAQDAVIEVGPGKGVLTQALAKVAGRVVAIELDERLANRLHEKFGMLKNLDIRKQDARQVDWGDLTHELRQAGFAKVNLVANLPYYLATQMVIHALADPRGCDRLVVMVQEEVARRMCAPPGGREYSAYSVALQYYGLPTFVVKVPPKAFRPAPRVSSAIVRIDRRLEPLVQVRDVDRFFYIVHAMFTHRRKTLRRSLQGTPEAPPQTVWEAALRKAGVDSGQRPETLSLPEFAAIIHALDAEEL